MLIQIQVKQICLINASILFFILLPSIDDLPTIHDSLSSITITVPDVYKTLISLDPEKPAGIDNIPPRVLQSCATALCEPLHHLFFLNH